ncbi:hypothetical protein MW887_010536 [Aspergillus wentii]|nr:hypothetical protein MW887_010536 [Aspergillus wentii]
MRLTPILQSTYPRLTSLKAAQLQRIAQATGIQSSGPKPALLDRLQAELPQSEYAPISGAGSHSHAKNGMSILSIDMGIQNLAFAHLLVPGSMPSLKASSSSGYSAPQIQLNAWRRMGVSDIDASSVFPSGISPPSSTSSKGASSVDAFHPSLYAKHAYTLITSLLATYQPTHILIERQRFRSGGGSAVQEWTLRVGVFEGMLYAVLHTLAQRGGGGGGVGGPFVHGVEPMRVARFWDGGGGGGSVEGETDGEKVSKKKRTNSKEGKKIKIDVVGGWLAANMGGEAGQTPSSSKICVGESPELRDLVDAYLCKWQGKKKRSSKKTDGNGGGVNIGKLDDLADCLLQGVTWLEWHTMRHRICQEGLDVMEFDRD